jgi:hypothetical protein
MYEKIREAVVSAALHIFETMYFIFLDPLDSDRVVSETVEDPAGDSDILFPASGSWWLKNEIRFSGHLSGWLRIFLPFDLGEMMTKNLLGFEDEVTEAQITDMGSELANMVCGNIFSLLDKKAVFTLSSPTTEKISFEDKRQQISPEDFVLDFSTEGYQVTIVVQLEKVPSS